MKGLYPIFILVVLLSLGCHANASSSDKDIIRLAKAASETDNRFQYPEHILDLALQASIDTYGPYEIIHTNITGTRKRMLAELQSGKNINVHNAPTRPEWEEKTIPIMFPLLKGLLNYRIFLIHRDNEYTFKNLQTLDDLKRLVAGVGEQWSTTKALRLLDGFNIETGTNYEGLFGMLMAKRFDYFIRGMNEVYREYDVRKDLYPQLMIEPYVVMELPLPWFLFVSPHYKKLAERIEYGLSKMKADGSFDAEFFKYHGESIQKANLANRKLFRLKNKLLKHHEIYDDPTYWFDPAISVGLH